jgi:hypothetical protein
MSLRLSALEVGCLLRLIYSLSLRIGTERGMMFAGGS